MFNLKQLAAYVCTKNPDRLNLECAEEIISAATRPLVVHLIMTKDFHGRNLFTGGIFTDYDRAVKEMNEYSPDPKDGFFVHSFYLLNNEKKFVFVARGEELPFITNFKENLVEYKKATGKIKSYFKRKIIFKLDRWYCDETKSYFKSCGEMLERLRILEEEKRIAAEGMMCL